MKTSLSYILVAALLYGCDISQGVKDGEAIELFNKKISWQQEREPENYRVFTEKFIHAFNSDTLSNIVPLASHGFLENQPQDKLIGFLGFFKNDFGRIRKMRFKYLDTKKQRGNKQNMALYLIEFEKGSQWDFRVAVNDSLLFTKLIITDNNYNEDLPLERNKTHLSLPFEKGEEWFVLWGGDTEEENYHVTVKPQKNAIDFVIRHPWSNLTYEQNGLKNEDYYAYGKSILSPCKGEIIKVLDGVRDNTPGKMNRKDLTGNTVIIKASEREYVLLAHFKNNSITVKEGDKVKRGDLLGLCGNSGNSSEPHLHMQIMDAPKMKDGIGIKMHFDKLILNDGSVTKNYSPLKGNRVKQIP